jgi:hypothetical protein
MFARLSDILSAATELLAANIRLAWVRVERLGARLVAMAALGVLAALSFCAALAGLAVVLAPELGPGVAIIVVSSGTLAVSLIGVAIIGAPFYSDTGKAPRAQAEEAREKLARLLPGTPEEPDPSTRQSSSAAGQPAEHHSLFDAAGRILTNPDAMASAAFAVVTVLGVKRSVRLARTIAGAAGTGIAVARAIRHVEHAAHTVRAQSNGHHTSSHEHASEPNQPRSAQRTAAPHTTPRNADRFR